jgi:hypothetical protein
MHDARQVETLLHCILRLAWEDPEFHNQLSRSPRPIVETEALRLGADRDSVAECIELLAKMPPCPDTFASRSDDLFLFHNHLFGE